jgi:hypothetical protein
MNDISITRVQPESARKILALEGENVSVWEARPFQIVSLLTMLEANANLFYFTTRYLQRLLTKIDKAIEERKGDSLLNRQEVRHTQTLTKRIEREAKKLQLSDVIDRLYSFEISEMQPLVGQAFTLERLKWELEELSKQIAKSLAQNKFMMIPAGKAGYYDQPRLFGQKVYRNFKSSRNDVKEAGNCYVVGRNTACVFHCMRVLEKGLHALVQDLNTRFNAGIHFGKTIEETNWGNIIDEIQKTLTMPKRLQVLVPKPTQQDLGFYSKAAKEFEYFKNAWRDDVSHSRSHYEESEAKVVIEHVSAFMQQLAIRLKE